MLSVNIICVGKLKEKYLADGIAEYAKRLRTMCKFAVVELPEVRLQKGGEETVVRQEGEHILQKLPAGYNIALCIEGRQLSSEDLSALLCDLPQRGHSAVNFIIGGSLGLSDAVKNKCELRLSVSKMTFPHQLFRLLLTEQIYRALSIGQNSKYHK